MLFFHRNKCRGMWNKPKRTTVLKVIGFCWTCLWKSLVWSTALRFTGPGGILYHGYSKKRLSRFSPQSERQHKLSATECFWHRAIFYSNIIDHDCSIWPLCWFHQVQQSAFLTFSNHRPVISIQLFLLKNNPAQHFPCFLLHKGAVYQRL